ncbi:hypothetical protein BKA62DRAFT_97580 [Auriculariales sp. MPI-PUGE-AT-0066]|nr:hypothetical protein BKA62DRAFT_97580 [Auriculariales sp. MPI-PUGE-AT-0066]
MRDQCVRGMLLRYQPRQRRDEVAPTRGRARAGCPPLPLPSGSSSSPPRPTRARVATLRRRTHTRSSSSSVSLCYFAAKLHIQLIATARVPNKMNASPPHSTTSTGALVGNSSTLKTASVTRAPSIPALNPVTEQPHNPTLAELHATLANLRARQYQVETMIAQLGDTRKLATPPRSPELPHVQSLGTGNPISNERSTANNPPSPIPSVSSLATASSPTSTPSLGPVHLASAAPPRLLRLPSINIGSLLNPLGEGYFSTSPRSTPLPSPNALFGPPPIASPSLHPPHRQGTISDTGARLGQIESTTGAHTHATRAVTDDSAHSRIHAHVSHTPRVDVDLVTTPHGQVPAAAGPHWRDGTSYSRGSSASLSPRLSSSDDFIMQDDVVVPITHLAATNPGTISAHRPAVHTLSSNSSTDSSLSSGSSSSVVTRAHLSAATRALLSGPPLRRPTQARGPKRHLQPPSDSLGPDSDISAAGKPVKDLPFHCTHSGCTAAFARRFELDRHTRTHASGPGSGVACPICGNVFRAARKDALRRHQLESIGCLRLQARLTTEELKALDCVTDDDRQRLQWQRQSSASSLSNIVTRQKRQLTVAQTADTPMTIADSLVIGSSP